MSKRHKMVAFNMKKELKYNIRIFMIMPYGEGVKELFSYIACDCLTTFSIIMPPPLTPCPHHNLINGRETHFFPFFGGRFIFLMPYTASSASSHLKKKPQISKSYRIRGLCYLWDGLKNHHLNILDIIAEAFLAFYTDKTMVYSHINRRRQTNQRIS